MKKAFPKIFTIGQKYILDIFENEVEITEKLDGSQFSFGKINGEVYIRSKGKMQELECPDKLFLEGAEYIKSIQHKLPEGICFYGEYFKKPKHNIISYSRIPKNHIILFGACNISEEFIPDYYKYAELLNLETVPVIYKGKVNDPEQLKELLNRESILGNAKIEGFVVKNYDKELMVGGMIIPIMCGKYVSEQFKEVHKATWSKDNTTGGRWGSFKEKYRTKARWLKAVFYLRDQGELEQSPRDIGKLMKQVNIDIAEEAKEEIKDFLWKEFGKDLLKNSIRGLAEWYKEYLMEKSFDE